MNKVYNTVWNESAGTWVVTSELTRKGGQRPISANLRVEPSEECDASVPR